jgi:hypothetical protein
MAARRGDGQADDQREQRHEGDDQPAERAADGEHREDEDQHERQVEQRGGERPAEQVAQGFE